MAGGISTRKKKGFRDIPIVGEYIETQKISYCPDCEKQGLKSKLGLRILQKDEPIPIDYDQFRQCHTCALILPIYELKKESKIKDTIETTRNPFEESKNVITSIHDDKPKISRELEEFKKELDTIEDKEEREDKRRIGLVRFISGAMNY